MNGTVRFGQFLFRAEEASPSPVSPSLIRARPTKVSNVTHSKPLPGGPLRLLPASCRPSLRTLEILSGEAGERQVYGEEPSQRPGHKWSRATGGFGPWRPDGSWTS
jgi:hypothetical protein